MSHTMFRSSWALLAIGVVILGSGQATPASIIAFDAPVTISSSNDVYVAMGTTLKYAYNWSNMTQTVNGVAFAGTNATGDVGSDLTWGTLGTPAWYDGFTSTENPFAGLPAAYQGMLAGAVYVWPDNTAGTVTLKGLTSGHEYVMQFWVEDARGYTSGLKETITSTGGNSQSLDFNSTDLSGGVGQYVIGRFTADAATQAFAIIGDTGTPTSMNAIQLREVVPEPGTLVLLACGFVSLLRRAPRKRK